MILSWVTLETVAVVFSIAYLLFALKENSLCWYCAFVSTAIYTWIFGDVRLYMESLLNIYYLVMAVYGWYQWRKGGVSHQGIEISCWQLRQHGLAIASVIILSLISGYLLAQNTGARLPYLDSFTTWGAVLTTVMVARKILENWLYWIVIDAASIYLYLDRELYQTVALFVLYVVLASVGYVIWRKRYSEQRVLGRESEQVSA
ncbi:MAG: nicotinamide riboside transporter PnuC [Porticoccus sp.]